MVKTRKKKSCKRWLKISKKGVLYLGFARPRNSHQSSAKRKSMWSEALGSAVSPSSFLRCQLTQLSIFVQTLNLSLDVKRKKEPVESARPRDKRNAACCEECRASRLRNVVLLRPSLLCKARSYDHRAICDNKGPRTIGP